MATSIPLETEQGTPDATDLPQYSLRRVLGVWAAAALPMGLLAWVAAPWLSPMHWTGRVRGHAPSCSA